MEWRWKEEKVAVTGGWHSRKGSGNGKRERRICTAAVPAAAALPAVVSAAAAAWSSLEQ